jgi:hypothetical protein
MITLCDDVIHVIIDNIHPHSFNDTFNDILKQYNTYLTNREYKMDIYEPGEDDAQVYNIVHTDYTSNAIKYALKDLKEHKKKNDIKKLDYFNAIYQLLELYKTHKMFHKAINQRLSYDYKIIMAILMEGFKESHNKKMVKVFSCIKKSMYSVSQKHSPAIKYLMKRDIFIFTNSGCLCCKKNLPAWWPIATLKETDWETHMPHISKNTFNKWNKMTDGYLSEGCCSFRCYMYTRPTRESIYDEEYGYISHHKRNLKMGEKMNLICNNEDCEQYITPIQAITNGTRFCDGFCRSEQAYLEYKNSYIEYNRGSRYRRRYM